MNNYIKTIVSGLLSYIQKSRGNWNQSDETAVDYIKNRTHWSEVDLVEVLPETNLNNGGNYNGVTIFTASSTPIDLVIGNTYIVNWNGVEYELVAVEAPQDATALGNLAIMGVGGDTGESFLIGSFPYYATEVYTTEAITEGTISIKWLKEVIHKIDAKYLPIKNILDGSAEGSVRTIGTNTEIGICAFAEGIGTIASGLGSHAEGIGTTASGEFQHVQGAFNIGDTENKYAHIVGNGDQNTLSNAHTLDWDGNAWFAGDVYVGGASQNDVNSNKVITEKEFPLPRDHFALTDIDNGYTYIIQMKNGNLVSRHRVSSIEVTTMPNKIEYYANEYFDDPTGMVVTATCADGSVIEITNYTCSNNRFAIGENTVTISYNEAGHTYTTTININAVEFDAATILIDFDYTANDDGTYTLTNWKQTLNGEPSTKMVIPDYSVIRL